MQEWDPEHFTSFEHLCEVTLATKPLITALEREESFNRLAIIQAIQAANQVA